MDYDCIEVIFLTWVEVITKWLKEGEDRSEILIDLPWDIEMEKNNGTTLLRSTHPSIPFAITVSISKEFAKLGIVTDIESDFIPQQDRLKMYKILLVMNGESNLMKIGLTGVESRVIIIVDLDLASLNKEEFNDALSAMIMGAYGVYTNLGLSEKLNQTAIKRIALMAYQKLEEIKDPNSVIKYLSDRVGLQKDQAKEIVDNLIKMREESRGKEEDLTYIR